LAEMLSTGNFISVLIDASSNWVRTHDYPYLVAKLYILLKVCIGDIFIKEKFSLNVH
jgi:hypothetical protein